MCPWRGQPPKADTTELLTLLDGIRKKVLQTTRYMIAENNITLVGFRGRIDLERRGDSQPPSLRRGPITASPFRFHMAFNEENNASLFSTTSSLFVQQETLISDPCP